MTDRPRSKGPSRFIDPLNLPQTPFRSSLKAGQSQMITQATWNEILSRPDGREILTKAIRYAAGLERPEAPRAPQLKDLAERIDHYLVTPHVPSHAKIASRALLTECLAVLSSYEQMMHHSASCLAISLVEGHDAKTHEGATAIGKESDYVRDDVAGFSGVPDEARREDLGATSEKAEAVAEAPRAPLKLNLDPAWLHKMADLERQCESVEAGGEPLRPAYVAARVVQGWLDRLALWTANDSLDAVTLICDLIDQMQAALKVGEWAEAPRAPQAPTREAVESSSPRGGIPSDPNGGDSGTLQAEAPRAPLTPDLPPKYVVTNVNDGDSRISVYGGIAYPPLGAEFYPAPEVEAVVAAQASALEEKDRQIFELNRECALAYAQRNKAEGALEEARQQIAALVEKWKEQDRGMVDDPGATELRQRVMDLQALAAGGLGEEKP